MAAVSCSYGWLVLVITVFIQLSITLIFIVAEENGKYFQSIQDGSHLNSPRNEPLRLMMDLQNELQDIADGFETRFTQVTRRGYQTLAGEIGKGPGPEVSVLPIQPQGQAVDDGDISDSLLSRSAEEVI